MSTVEVMQHSNLESAKSLGGAKLFTTFLSSGTPKGMEDHRNYCGEWQNKAFPGEEKFPWTDETKSNCYWNDGKISVQRRKELLPIWSASPDLMAWVCAAAGGTGSVPFIDDTTAEKSVTMTERYHLLTSHSDRQWPENISKAIRDLMKIKCHEDKQDVKTAAELQRSRSQTSGSQWLHRIYTQVPDTTFLFMAMLDCPITFGPIKRAVDLILICMQMKAPLAHVHSLTSARIHSHGLLITYDCSWTWLCPVKFTDFLIKVSNM